MIWLLAAASILAAIPSGLRWLRVAQREHYLFPAATRFSIRWWGHGLPNRTLAAVAVVGAVGAWFEPLIGLLTVLAQLGPLGLSVRGRTSPLAWTGRLRRVAAVSGTIFLAAVAAGAALGSGGLIAAALLLLPAVVDASLLILSPLERRLGDRWVEKAARRLESSGARVVAITGSYGKTTTKQYVHHLISDSLRSVASPASFNNRMGLARAVNEHLVPGTEVFIAEMGTYGPGEIEELCRWIKPDIAAMVAIGPVHLERFGTEERIVAAKSEILDRAERAVIAIDHPLLADLVTRRASSLEITTVSVDGKPADVVVDNGTVVVGGTTIGTVPDGVFPTNLAVAVAIAQALGVEVEARGLETIPPSEHRQSLLSSPAGFTIIDDTFNSNPAGAARALTMLAGYKGRKLVVTPGMVELGPVQDEENEAFARAAAAVCDEVIIVGGTNRKALMRGAENGRASVTVVADRETAVELVRERLGAGDVVLYENDLPDHYP
mgnify:FL=1